MTRAEPFSSSCCTGFDGELLELLVIRPDLEVTARCSSGNSLRSGHECIAREQLGQQVIEQLLIRGLACVGILLTKLRVRVDQQNLPELIAGDLAVGLGLNRARCVEHRANGSEVKGDDAVNLREVTAGPRAGHLATAHQQ